VHNFGLTVRNITNFVVKRIRKAGAEFKAPNKGSGSFVVGR